ncbi:MAG: hypothetical protein KQH57_07540 [Actinomycetales bacterium]|nr:hypothetical protein [Actinomycetales bacterium]
MTVPTVPTRDPQPTAPEQPGAGLTRRAYVVNLAYVAWFWVMFAAGYWVYSWFDLDPSAGQPLRDAGLAGWVATIGYALVATSPSWVGAWFAGRARVVGAGRAGTIALVVNLVVGAGLFVAMLAVV